MFFYLVMLEVPEEDYPQLEIAGSFLDSTYVLKNIHFHWGTSSREGSEHSIANFAYPFEVST